MSQRNLVLFIFVQMMLAVLSGNRACSQVLQSRESSPSNGDFHVGSVFLGSNPGNGTAGIGGGTTFRVYRWIGAAAEVNVFTGTEGVGNLTTLVEYLVGPRIAAPLSRSGRITVFGDGLLGGATFHNGSTQHSYYYGNGTGGALAGDGGVDVRLSRHVAVRGQAGVSTIRFSTRPTTTSITSWRAGTFLVYRF